MASGVGRKQLGGRRVAAGVLAAALALAAATPASIGPELKQAYAGAARAAGNLRFFYQMQFGLNDISAPAVAARTARCSASSAASTRGS